MDINSLTVGEAKSLMALFGAAAQSPTAPNPVIGKYCIARCYAAGVHAGVVQSVDGENVILKDSRRLWQWKAADGIALSGVAQHGLKQGKIDTENPLIYLSGVCELIPCSTKAEESIRAAK